MQVAVYEHFLTQKQRLARAGTWGGLAVLFIGFAIAIFAEYIAQYVGQTGVLFVMYAAMITGLIAFNNGRNAAMRWVSRPREDEILASSLMRRGLDDRYWLLNYMKQTPAHHILVGPPGVYVLHVRAQDGDIVNQGKSWSRKMGLSSILRNLFEGSFGNPTAEAWRDVAAVRRHLASVLPAEEAQAVPVQPLVVFTNPRAKLTLREPEVPVVTPNNLYTYMRRQLKENRLNADQLQLIGQSFGL